MSKTQPDFESMSIDELIDYKLAGKREVEAIRDRMKAAHAVYTRKVERMHIERRIEAAGLTGLVIVPDTATINLEGKTPE